MENNTIGFKETNAGELTPQQEAAVAMVLDGKSDTEISRELKMRRQTVNEWRNHNIEFMLELKMRRDQVWEKQREKLGEAVEKALDVLIGYLEHDDEEIRLKTALLLLKLPATQENLKMKEAMEMKSRYQEVERKIKSAAEQAGLGE